jgi:hypothetical protein
MKITFTINEYDSNGVIWEEGVYLHFEDTRIKVAESIADFQKVVDQIQKINVELQKNYI